MCTISAVTLFGFSAQAEAPKPTSISPVDYLQQHAGKDFEVLYRIGLCESGFKADARNPNSTASGIFQFLKSTWAKWGVGNVFNPYANIDAAIRLYRAELVKGSDWLPSAHCWKR